MREGLAPDSVSTTEFRRSSKETIPRKEDSMTTISAPKQLKQYECGGFPFTGKAAPDYYDRHLVFDHAVAVANAGPRERFEAVARSLRDLLTQRWLLTQETHDRENPKRVYYLSMEFLIGRTLVNNITNMGVEQFVKED